MHKKLIVALILTGASVLGITRYGGIPKATDPNADKIFGLGGIEAIKLPSLEGMKLANYHLGFWAKYVNPSYTSRVKNISDDAPVEYPPLGSDPALAYVYINVSTGERISFSAFEEYPEDSIVDAIADALISKPRDLLRSNYYLVAGGSSIGSDWGFYTFTPTNYSQKDGEKGIYYPYSIIVKREDGRGWVAYIQGTEDYNITLRACPETQISAQAKDDLLLLSQNLHEKPD